MKFNKKITSLVTTIALLVTGGAGFVLFKKNSELKYNSNILPTNVLALTNDESTKLLKSLVLKRNSNREEYTFKIAENKIIEAYNDKNIDKFNMWVYLYLRTSIIDVCYNLTEDCIEFVNFNINVLEDSAIATLTYKNSLGEAVEISYTFLNDSLLYEVALLLYRGLNNELSFDELNNSLLLCTKLITSEFNCNTEGVVESIPDCAEIRMYNTYNMNMDELDYYYIKKGDTLSAIAAKYGITLEKLIELNGNFINNPNLIEVDLVIFVPKQVSNNTVRDTSNYYKEYEWGKVPKGYVKGLDISQFCGNIDWNNLEAEYKNGNFSYIILRMAENLEATNSRQMFNKAYPEFRWDTKFKEYLKECINRGIPYGFYIMTRGITEAEIKEQASATVTAIKEIEKELGLKLEFKAPIFGDFFEGDAKRQWNLGNEAEHNRDKANLCANLMLTWCREIENNGYYPGFYFNYNLMMGNGENTNGFLALADSLIVSELNKYCGWGAKYVSSEVRSTIDEFGTYKNHDSINWQIVEAMQLTSRVQVLREDGKYANVDGNIAKESMLEEVRKFYKEKYGKDYYSDILAYSFKFLDSTSVGIYSYDTNMVVHSRSRTRW